MSGAASVTPLFATKGEAAPAVPRPRAVPARDRGDMGLALLRLRQSRPADEDAPLEATPPPREQPQSAPDAIRLAPRLTVERVALPPVQPVVSNAEDWSWVDALNKPKRCSVTLRLEPNNYYRLKGLSLLSGRTMQDIMHQAVNGYISRCLSED